MAAAKRDRRRQDIAKFVQTYRDLGAPDASAAEKAVWLILARHGSKEAASRAFKSLWRRFVSINEFRVGKPAEIAAIIERNVKNDARVVADQARGFLRRFFKEFQTVDLSAADVKTVDGLKRYLTGLPDSAQEIAMALALHHCALEVQAEAELAQAEADGKPRKRPEQHVTHLANRLRLLFAIAAHGPSVSTARPLNHSRAFLKAWSYSALPSPAKKASKGTTKKAAKKTAKKAPAKKSSARPARKQRPRTTRPARGRTAASKKKSSRR
jgi:hypothetical protein